MSNILTKPIPKGCLYFIVMPFLGIFFLLFLGLIDSVFLLEIPFHMLSGWAFHALETLPPFLAKWRSAVLPVGCLIIAVWLTHSFICRWAKIKRPDLKWRIKYTLSIYSLLFLSSAAAIAMSGIVHQFFWLSKEDVIERRGVSDKAILMLTARNLNQAICGSYNMNQRYPHSLDEIVEYYLEPDHHWYSKRGVGVPEPFILIQPRSSDKLEHDEVTLVSPYFHSIDQYAVGFGDGSVRWMKPAMLKRFLNKSEEPEPDDPHE
jgi:hypothetical protein